MRVDQADSRPMRVDQAANYPIADSDLLSNLLPAAASLDPTNQFQNVTLLLNAFIAPFIASLGAATIRNILGKMMGDPP